jgi:hypothetical protein
MASQTTTEYCEGSAALVLLPDPLAPEDVARARATPCAGCGRPMRPIGGLVLPGEWVGLVCASVPATAALVEWVAGQARRLSRDLEQMWR